MGPLLAGSLTDALLLRSYDREGQPQAVEVQISAREGRSALPIPSLIQTGDQGLARLPVRAIHPRFWFDLETSGASSSRSNRRFKQKGVQFVLDSAHLQVAPDDELPFRVHSLHQRGPLFVDLWYGERWLASSTVELNAGLAQGKLKIPELKDDPALLWIQAYKSAFLPGQARGGRHLLFSSNPQEGLRWLRSQLMLQENAPEHLEKIPLSQEPLLLEYLLGRPGRPERDPPLLADSGVSARQSIKALKELWQGRFALSMFLVALLLLLGLGILIYQHNRDVNEAWSLAGGDVDGEQGSRKRALLDASYLLIILGLFLFAMIQLMLSIHW